ncbi:MAG: hypothetical protein IKR05_06630 [Prevotella sp.]|nr:hypothetical protein [Prevotella sp.]
MTRAAKHIVSSLLLDKKVNIPTIVTAKMNLTATMMKWKTTLFSGDLSSMIRQPFMYAMVRREKTATTTNAKASIIGIPPLPFAFSP